MQAEDELASIGIVIGAVIIRYTGWQQIDPLLSILIGVLIIWTAWDIIKESLNILLEGLPRGLELQSVVTAMRDVEGVLDVHDLHIWSLGSDTRALSCHVLIEDLPPSTSERSEKNTPCFTLRTARSARIIAIIMATAFARTIGSHFSSGI